MPDYTHLSLIALRTVKYNDRNSILSAYTLQAGRQSFLVPAGNGKEASRRRALLMPLSLVECSSRPAPGREILTMKDISPLIPLHGIHSHPIKASVAMFIAEVLGITLRESQPDKALFAFLVETVAALNDLESRRIVNFHIAFLRQLSHFIGIEPDFGSYTPNSHFDIINGVFRRSAPSTSKAISLEQSALVGSLGRMHYRNMHLWRLTRDQRNRLTDEILSYFSLHYTSMRQLTTLPILRAL